MLVLLPDKDTLRQRFVSAKPFPFVKIDDILDPSFAADVAKAYPTFETAMERGRMFKSVNERLKIQVTDSKIFPEPIRRLNETLAAPEFLRDLSYVTGIPDLLADEQLLGGGMHITGPGGRLDVHVDFNLIENRNLHRRLNLLIYFNQLWETSWGGHLQLWDQTVSSCKHEFVPRFNRCVIFETSDISFHGVTPVSENAPMPRHSFAVYYYTHEAPPNWKGHVHSTIFRARPDERLRRYLLMPAERAQQQIVGAVRRAKRRVKDLFVAS